MTRFASAPWPLKTAYVLAVTTAGATLVLGLAAVIALLGLKRLSADIDSCRCAGVVLVFRGDPEVRRWLGIGVLSAFSLAAVVILGIVRNRRPPLHGAARWASEAELKKEDLRAEQGIVIGRKSGQFLTFGGPEHVMLYAPTRTGKDVGVVIPNLLTWPDSVVVLDIKRENLAASAGFRAAHGQQVILFDPSTRKVARPASTRSAISTGPIPSGCWTNCRSWRSCCFRRPTTPILSGPRRPAQA